MWLMKDLAKCVGANFKWTSVLKFCTFSALCSKLYKPQLTSIVLSYYVSQWQALFGWMPCIKMEPIFPLG